MRGFLLLMVIPFLSLGCATVTEPKAGAITLEDALKSVGTGLVFMKQAELQANNNQEFKSGLMASEAEVVFNVSASKSKDGKLYVELTPVTASPVQGKAGGSIGTSESVTRGNQITIKFRNIAFSKTTTTTTKDGQSVTVEGITDAKQLKEFLKVAEEGGVHPMSDQGTGTQTGNNNNNSNTNNNGGLTIMSVPIPGLDASVVGNKKQSDKKR